MFMSEQEIASKIIAAIELDNGCRFLVADSDRSALCAGVGAMLTAGCKFTADEIDNLAYGEEFERDRYFESYAGYDETNEALNSIFNGELE
jgi:hypothetical protein